MKHRGHLDPLDWQTGYRALEVSEVLFSDFLGPHGLHEIGCSTSLRGEAHSIFLCPVDLVPDVVAAYWNTAGTFGAFEGYWLPDDVLPYVSTSCKQPYKKRLRFILDHSRCVFEAAFDSVAIRILSKSLTLADLEEAICIDAINTLLSDRRVSRQSGV